MKLHLPYLLRRAVVRALFAAAAVVATLASSTYADMITPDGRTATSVIQSGNVYDVYTGTVRGSTGFNSFSTFDVYAETTANLHLADGTGKLINVVRDSASHIDGVLNSYKDGRIGGDVYFLNPNGIIVGKSGVINVGSISMSTPTAAFVEQLIARDGSISATATQAVLAGDMPINEKGTISIKGKVNARNSVEMRAGTVEVKGGEINTGVKFREMVNTGKRKVDTQGMSIQNGRLSFGKKPAKARRAVAKAKERKQERKTDIAIFADDVLLDGGDLNADWVYIDPDQLQFSNQAISGNYTLEARVIVLNNISVKEGEKLTSFTLNAANELADGTFEGNVAITLSNSNITADRVDITASATTNAAEAAITISKSTIQTTLAENALNISATSESGNTRVDIQDSTLTGAGDVEVAAVSLNGNAALTLGEASGITADIVTLLAGAITGDAGVAVQGKIAGGNTVNITASTGNVVGSEAEKIQDTEFTAEGGGDAAVTVSGTVEAKGALTVAAIAQGTRGNARLDITGKLSSLYTETKTVGELALERTPAETVQETDTEEQVNAKNAAYMKRYAEYLKSQPTGTAATATIELAANASAGNASITQAAASELRASLNTAINANAAQAASILLEGKTDSGDISASAKGETATLRVAEGASLASHPHQSFTQDGTVISVSKNNGGIGLEARTRREKEPTPAPEPDKKDGVLLEVAGTLTARREAQDGAGEGGSISLASDGRLTVTDKAVLDASSDNGQGGTIGLDAPEYELQSPLGYKVDGTPGHGTISLMNHEGLTGDNINNADEISSDFIKKVLNLSYANGDAPKEWTSDFMLVKLSGNIVLTKDVEASIQNAAIADGTHVTGNGHSLTLTNSALHRLSSMNVVYIGKDVTIEGVSDFTFKFQKKSLADALTGFYIFSPTSLTVGENFKVNASGNVSITMEGFGNTYIEFGKGLDIQAGGDVTISASTENGWGGCLGSTTPTDVMGTIVKMIPGAGDSEVGKAFSKVGLVKFEASKFFIMTVKHLLGKKNSKEQLPLIGVRVSKASVSFADNNAGAIRGKTVTISSSSSADQGTRQTAGSGGDAPLALSIGYIYNNSKVDLGKNLTITATGASATGASVSITSTTKSKLSLESCFTSNTEGYALGMLVSVGTDFNAVNVDKSVTIHAAKDINIGTASDIETRPFMSLGSGWERKGGKEEGKEYEQEAPPANNLFMLGVNLLVHKNQSSINGALTSNQGNIGMQSVDNIVSSLTMSGSLQYTQGLATEKKPEREQGFLAFLGTAFRECIVIDLGIAKMRIGENFKELIDKDNLGEFFKKGQDLHDALAIRAATVDRSIALSIATDIVVTDNKLQFNGTAAAEKGSVTLNAASSIEAACGAETSIVGLPSRQAVAGSISVPVLIGGTTVEIGSNATITAGKDISVSSSTALPMSFDLLGWRDWAKFVTNAGGKRTPSQFLTALRGSLQYVRDYKDSGDFGILNSLTSSHASTLMKGTGTGQGDSKTIGGDLVVDVRNLDTKTIINDGAHLTAGGKLGATSSATGTQVTFAGQLPIYLTLCRPAYISTIKADSGFGGSIIVGEKTLNTVTYIGAATLEARQLEVDATGDAFMMEMSVAGGFGSADDGVQGGVNVIVENKMTVSEISGGAKITLSGNGEKEGSSIKATDKSVLLNISGMEADGGKTAVGVGVAITVNNAFTAAMLGNNMPIGSSYESNWKSMWGESAKPFDRAGAITLNFLGDSALGVEAVNKGTLVNIGISAAVHTGKNGKASVAASVGVDYSCTEATARQYGVTGTGNNGRNNVATKAADTTTIVSVAGDVAVNTGGGEKVNGAGALSVNRAVMDTTAYVTDCNYSGVGEFTLDTSNKATAVAVDVAAGVGAADAGIAAGSAWNSLSGNTGSHLSGGSVGANKVSVTSLTDLTSFSCTLGAAVNISLGANGAGGAGIAQDIANILNESFGNNNSNQLENSFSDLKNLGGGNNANDSLLGGDLGIGEDFPALMAANGYSFDMGASISRNAVGMSSKAVVEGCSITSSGALEVTAQDTSVITAVSVGAAVDKENGIGAGGVFSFAPVSSTTEAAIRQKKGAGSPLTISAGSLKLHATDNHRERVWSFGGGYGDSAGVGMVLSWGSFAGATTLALIENVNATIGSSVDILASSDLDATFISVGGSASKKYAAVTGMVNYLNFNNTVITDIKDSTLTVTAANGSIKALSQGTRTFADGVGDLAIRMGGKKGAAIGGALSFVYVGGNGTNDTNLTQMLVSGSTINNSGTTDLLATSSTTGTLAGVNAALAGGKGITFTGSFSWFSDASFTQVDISDSTFNKRGGGNDKNAKIKAEATGTSNLTLGLGSLSAQIGKGGGVGVGIGVLKDNSTTSATMQRSRVESARDFTLHASATSNLSGLVIGGAGSGLVGVSGGAFASTIAHNVIAEMKESIMNMNGALTIKADNHSNVGKDKGTRFTLANGALGGLGGGVGVAVSCINVEDQVVAKAHNVSVNSGSMDVLAEEHSDADAVTVNMAGGLYVGMDVDVVRPVLRGAARASITSDLLTIADNTPVGITTTGNLNVQATNTQWMRSHLWAFALSVNPKASLAVNICVNDINMAGSSNALIQGNMPLNIGGDLNVKADTVRTATYTTVPVSGSLGLSLNIDVNSLRVSSDTSSLTNAEKEKKTEAAAQIDKEIDEACKLLQSAKIELDKDTSLTVSSDVRGAMSNAAAALAKIETPETTAKVDLGGNTATVGGNAAIKATDTITTTPTTVPVTGGILAIAPHFGKTKVESTVEAIVNNTVLNAGGDITIDAKQKHTDNFHTVGVAIAGVAGTSAVYEWTDNATTAISLAGSTTLKSTGGSVTIGTDSDISETFHHVNVGVAIGKIAFLLPTFRQTESNTLTIGNGVGIEARNAVTIGTNSKSKLDASTYDITLAAINAGLNSSEIIMSTTPALTIGDNTTITGGSVGILQNIHREIGIVEDHIAATGLSLSFPFLTITDTVNATLTVGDGSAITATTGDLTIASNANTKAILSFLGVNAIGISASGAQNKFTEKVTNKVKLGKNVKLSAESGAMAVRADNRHSGNMSGYNITANALNLTDELISHNHGAFTADVAIGTGFNAIGKALTLEAINTEEYLCHGKKVTVSLAVNPYSKNAIDVQDTSTATITLEGGDVLVERFNAKALTDVAVKVNQMLGGGSITIDVNIGKVKSDVTQTSTIILGTDGNKLDILTDDVSITAHNKHYFDRLDATTDSIIFGGDIGLVSGTSKGTVDAKQTLNATVTLGSGSKIRRRGDAAHYLKKDGYKALVSATNNVDSRALINLFSGGILNANCVLTTWNATTANATLNLNGSIDTWGDTELTAYSHAIHVLNNSLASGAIVPTFNSDVKNTIDTADRVNINGLVESIGNVVIQSGSAGGRYKLVDGTTVIPGDDDTNTTVYSWGRKDAVIHNKRSGSITINKDVKAGGEIAIYNDSSANTVKKPFKQTKGSEDYRNAAIDTAAEVTSSITVGADAMLYAGLGSAVKVSFSTDGGTPVMEFSSSQRIFDDSTQANGVWTATAETVEPLFEYTAGKNGKKAVLSLKPLTLPGMAFRIETKAARSVFNGKLTSPAEHGLDIYFPLGLNADVETQGATLRGHETGLSFNRQFEDHVIYSCPAPKLYLNEGVAIRSDATGNLTLSGKYEFPYSLLHASSLYDLVISGEVRCGTTTMQAGGNFRFDNPQKDYSLQGPLDMYTGLFNGWEQEAQKKLVDHAKTVAANSGDNESKTSSSVPSWFDDATYSKEYSFYDVRNEVNSKPSSIEAMGTVSITAKVVDINGEIYSGPQSGGTIVIPAAFQVLDAKGTPITPATARILYERDKSKSLFKLAGYSGVTLMYDCSTNQITLNDIVARDSGIEITGIIVNSDPTGRGGLHAMGSRAKVEIDNRSPYLLNIGNVDLTSQSCKGITLHNTATGKTITYQESSTLSQYEPADYCLRLTKETKTQLTESGRLTFSGSEGSDKDTARRGVFDGKVAGYVGSKDDGRKTIIDRIDVNTEKVETTKALSYEYVTRPGSMTSTARATSTQTTPGSRTFTYIKKDAMHRDKYVDMKYDVTTTNELLIRANNKIKIDFGGDTGEYSSFTVKSGDVNFLGKVMADICTVNAGNSITALPAALVDTGTLIMTAGQGSIGTEQQAFTFNATKEASMTAGQNIFLTTYKDMGKGNLNAGMRLDLQSRATVNALEYHAGGLASIAASGSITVTNGRAGRTALLSQTGSITADYKAGTASGPGILTAEAEQDIRITSGNELMLYHVESRRGGVNLHAEKGITSVRSIDISGFTAVPGSKSLSLKDQAAATVDDLADEYYAKLLYCERLYYEKDAEGRYINRKADGTTFVLPDEKEAREELRTTFHDLYHSGKGAYLGGFVYSLSGTEAVGKAEFTGETDALRYLADNPGKLEALADAYYDKLIADLTTDICNLHGSEAKVDYGPFNETIYRLYWQKDETGTTFINQVQSGDNKGQFISPRKYDANGNDIGQVYSDEMCQAITAQFQSKNPRSTYKSKRSEVLKTLASAKSGYLAATILLNQVNAKVATAIGKQSGDLIETTVRAATDITLTTNTNPDPQKGGFIGSNKFHFTISPAGQDKDGKYVYSDWATAFLAELGKTKAGAQILDVASGEYTISLDYVDVAKGSFSELDMFFLQQAAPSDIEKYPGGVSRIWVSSYIGVEAPVINASGNTVRLSSNGGFDLGKGTITAKNLYLSTPGTISGSLAGDDGTIGLFAEGGIGAADNYFGIAGSSTYTIGSAGDIYLKVKGDVTVDSLYGQHVTVDTREGRLIPESMDQKKANIIGRRVDWYGNLDTGLRFQTFGATRETGGLHWHGGSSSDLKYGALNTAYTFWFVVENDTNALPASGDVEIDYCGRLVLLGLTRAESATFHQIDAGSDRNILEFTEAGYFNSDLTFSGESSYTVLAPDLLTLNSDSDISVGGNADLRLAGIDSAGDNTIQFNSTGNLALSSYRTGDVCNIMDALELNSTGCVSLANINSTATLTVNGRNGVSGTEVSGPQIIANSTNAGVFLNADTNDLSGSALRYFVVDLEPLAGGGCVTVHDIDANGATAKVIVRAIADELLLDDIISGAVLEFYNTGSINRDVDVTLDADYPFLNVWRENDFSLRQFNFDSIKATLHGDVVWVMEEITDDACEGSDAAQKLRRKVDGEEIFPALQPLRFTDSDGNDVSPEQYARSVRQGHPAGMRFPATNMATL